MMGLGKESGVGLDTTSIPKLILPYTEDWRREACMEASEYRKALDNMKHLLEEKEGHIQDQNREVHMKAMAYMSG